MEKTFQEAIRATGLEPPDVIEPGKFHRFPGKGKKNGNEAGWCKLFLDGRGGVFGDWSAGWSSNWQIERPSSNEEIAQFNEEMKKARVEAEKILKEKRKQAETKAEAIWKNSTTGTHPYLDKKGIQAHGTKIYKGSLVVPVRNGDKLMSLQFISASGDKIFLTEGRTTGGYFFIGKFTESKTLCVCEGFATGTSIHEATGHPVAVAFNAGNLLSVAKTLREKFAGQIIVCADDDADTAGNPGITKATEAGQSVNGIVVKPIFKNRPQDVTDFNDLHGLEGLEAVKACLKTAIPPKEDAHLSTPSASAAHLHTPPKLAEKPDILSAFAGVLCKQGVVGEERNAKVTYLAITSRLLADPVSLAIKGISSSGKSFTTEATLKFFPKTAILPMTAMSERALIYMKEEFCHRTIVLFEAVALREQREKTESNLTAYFVRSLLSEGRISYPVVVKTKEGLETKTIVKEGPTNIIITTTATSLHGENETRLISLPTNDTASQTRAIMLKTAEGKSRDTNLSEWIEFQQWLEKAERRVVIPYARYLAENVPPVAVRLRRDFRAILRLIETHAILHQVTRDKDEDGRIIANESDYLTVRNLVIDLISEGIGATVSRSMRETVECVRDHAGTDGATVREIAEKLKIDRSAAQRRIHSAREKGYITNIEEKRGRPGRYVTGDPMPGEIELLPKGVRAQPDPICTPKTEEMPKYQGFSEGVQVCTNSDGGKEPETPQADNRTTFPDVWTTATSQPTAAKWESAL